VISRYPVTSRRFDGRYTDPEEQTACYAVLAYNMNTYDLDAPARPTEKALP